MRSELTAVIVGAGVIGASIAWHLQRRGVRVILLDRGAEPGAGSTSRATGGFRAQFDTEVNIRLSLLSREKLRAFHRDVGADPGYDPAGYLFLATSDSELHALQEAQALQRDCGLHEASMLSRAEALTLNPAIGDPSMLGAAFCPTDGFIRPMNILRGYLDAATRDGADVRFNCEWLGWETSGAEIAAANTSRGRVAGDLFVNAAGAWAGVPVSPLRRNIAATAPTSLLPARMPMTVWSADWFHLRVRDGRVLLLWPDDPPDDNVWLDRIREMVRRRMPGISALPIVETWSGLYEMSPDEHALLGRSPAAENLYVAIGSSGHGVMHAPALGQLLSEIMVEGEASIDVSALSPTRFAT